MHPMDDPNNRGLKSPDYEISLLSLNLGIVS